MISTKFYFLCLFQFFEVEWTKLQMFIKLPFKCMVLKSVMELEALMKWNIKR